MERERVLRRPGPPLLLTPDDISPEDDGTVRVRLSPAKDDPRVREESRVRGEPRVREEDRPRLPPPPPDPF